MISASGYPHDRSTVFHVVVIKLLRVDAVSLNVYLLCELFYGDIIEVHVRDSRKKPFEYEHICFSVGEPFSAAFARAISAPISSS